MAQDAPLCFGREGWIISSLLGWSLGLALSWVMISPMIETLPAPDGTLATPFIFLIFVGVNFVTIIANAVVGLSLVWSLRRAHARG